MAAEPPPFPAPCIVRPRKPTFTYRPIIALTERELLLERHGGLILPADQLPHVLVSEPSSIIVCQGFGVHLDALRQRLGKRDDFQYQVTPRYAESRNNDDGHIRNFTRIYDAVVNLVGFQGLEKGNYKSGKRWTRYHYPLDPIHFVRQSIDDLYPESESRLRSLLRFGQEVREWCKINGLEVKPSAGGLAAQLLKDQRFYPEPRRKAPRVINSIARFQLPGNYYRLYAKEAPATHIGVYLDMSNAHHEAARTIQFPDANTLHAYGRWAEDSGNPFTTVRSGEPPNLILSRPGLFNVSLAVPHIPRELFPPPYMERQDANRQVWLYSNELEAVEELGGEILAVHSALVSDECEPGINRYAWWALAQIRQHPHWKPWLKPTLHATYGCLAARAVPFETGYHRMNADAERTEYPLGRVWVPAYVHKTRGNIESRIVNIIHRGMIEAEVRKQVLAFARHMQAGGYPVLAVYADSIFVEGSQLPFLPAPWRIAAYCSNLRFLSATHFTSDEETRLPGVPRNRREAQRESRLLLREKLVSSVGQTNHSTGG